MNSKVVNGNQIEFLREEYFSMTQEEVANQIGMSRSNLSSVEIGRVKPSLLLILVFSIAASTDPLWVICGADDQNYKNLLTAQKSGVENYDSSSVFSRSKQRAERVISYLPKRLKFARERINVSQRKLAGLVGLAQSNVSDIERGSTVPNCEALIEIAEILNVSTNVLLSYSLSHFNLHSWTLGFDKDIGSLILNQLNELEKLLSSDCRIEHREHPFEIHNDLYSMVSYLQHLYISGDNDLRAWAKIQFQRAFPEYKKWLSENSNITSTEPISKMICMPAGQGKTINTLATVSNLKENESNLLIEPRNNRLSETINDLQDIDINSNPIRRGRREL